MFLIPLSALEKHLHFPMGYVNPGAAKEEERFTKGVAKSFCDCGPVGFGVCSYTDGISNLSQQSHHPKTSLRIKDKHRSLDCWRGRSLWICELRIAAGLLLGCALCPPIMVFQQEPPSICQVHVLVKGLQ